MAREQKIGVVESYIRGLGARDFTGVPFAESVSFQSPLTPTRVGRDAIEFLESIFPAIRGGRDQAAHRQGRIRVLGLRPSGDDGHSPGFRQIPCGRGKAARNPPRLRSSAAERRGSSDQHRLTSSLKCNSGTGGRPWLASGMAEVNREQPPDDGMLSDVEGRAHY